MPPPAHGDVVLVKGFQQLPRLVRPDHVVGVHEGYPLAHGLPQPGTHRRALAQHGVLDGPPDGRTLGGGLVDYALRAVSAPVERHDELPAVGVVSVEGSGVGTERRADASFLVVGRNDDGEVHAAAFSHRDGVI